MTITYSVPPIIAHYRRGGSWIHEPLTKFFDPSTRTLLVLLRGAWLSDASARYYDYNSLGYKEVVLCAYHDTYVLNMWAADIELQRVRLLPDGNGELIRHLECEERDRAGVPRARSSEWEVFSGAIKYRGRTSCR